MSYEAGTASSISDLFSKLNTFAAANGWTINHSASDRLFLTRSGVSVAFRWDSTTPTCAGIYQHTAFINSATAPGNHTNDSGQGEVSGSDATLLTGRHVPLTNSTSRYWFFEADTYIHVVVETAASRVVHFGFGLLLKKGTWTGGSYSYGTRYTVGGLSNSETYLLDGFSQSPAFCGSLNIESLPNQTASGRWGITWAGTSGGSGNDRGGTARELIQGGYRGGPIAKNFARMGGAINNGVIPLYSLGCWYKDRSLARWYELGHMPDVRGVNMRWFSSGDEVTIGSDVWLFFPARYLPVIGAGNTGNAGVAYKKVTT